jgi:sugar lactone lactonase YvrE
VKYTTFSSVILACGLAASGCTDSKACDPDAPGTICTVAGEGTNGWAPPNKQGGDNGPAVDAYLSWPQDTVIAPNGDLWIEDFNNYQVRAVGSDGIIKTVIGSGLLGDSPDPGETSCPALQAAFNHTTHLAFHNDGTTNWLYMAAWHGSRVKRLDYDAMTVENYAGLGVRTRYTGDDGPAMTAALDLPTSIAFDPQGNVTIMDQANQVIRQVTPDGMIHRIAGRCVIELDPNEPEPCAAPTQCPNSDKWVCGRPEVYCGTTGEYNGTADCTQGFSGDGGPALDLRMAQDVGQFSRPGGRIAYDGAGNLIFADSGNNRLRRIGTDGIVNTIAGTGEKGFSGDGGPATAAKLSSPVDIAVADDGTIYFTDTDNSCVRKIDTAGTISTVAGMCNPVFPASDANTFHGDGGPPEKAELNQPAGIDLVGNKLYISDTYNNRVRVVNL